MRTSLIISAFALGILVVGTAGAAWAEPTNITVRVISKDAKFIGTSMGGAHVTIRDAKTGELLTEGDTRGGTGDTNRIMRAPRQRGVPLSTEGTAGFSATLDLDRPRLIEVSAVGPSSPAQSANRVSATQWVVPGKHLTGGDGWLLEMPGFAVDLLDPPAQVKLSRTVDQVVLQAKVTMMCGCPIMPGGLWDADRYEVTALIFKDGQAAGEVPLTFAGTTSQFSGTLNTREPGHYEALVYAYDPETGNTGVDSASFEIIR
jgi:hypothetical protein